MEIQCLSNQDSLRQLLIYFQFTRAGDDTTVRYNDDFKLIESKSTKKRMNGHAAASKAYKFIIKKRKGTAIQTQHTSYKISAADILTKF